MVFYISYTKHERFLVYTYQVINQIPPKVVEGRVRLNFKYIHFTDVAQFMHTLQTAIIFNKLSFRNA